MKDKRIVVLISITVVLGILFLSIAYNNGNQVEDIDIEFEDNSTEGIQVHFISNDKVIDVFHSETAITPSEKYDGLSNRDSIDGGMLFVYEREDIRTFVMPNMRFGIDIVFIDANCVVNEIYHADKPDPDETGWENKHTYTGTGQYVLEVPYMYTDDKLDVGDKVVNTYCTNI